MSDLAAASVQLQDGRIAECLVKVLGRMYPWDGSYAVLLEYNGHMTEINRMSEGYSEKVVRTYPVEFGGELRVTMALYT